MMAAAPICSATSAGNTNIPVPTVIFTTAQASPKTPIVRFSPVTFVKTFISLFDACLVNVVQLFYRIR